MKKILLSCLVAFALLGTGCHKDEQYEAQKYGILNTEVKGLGFVKSIFSEALLADATPQKILSVEVGVSSNELPKTAINYTVVASPTLIPAGTTLLPASAYTFKSTNTVPAGAVHSVFEIVLTNASLLNSNLTYGVAFTLTSADNGYTVAQNSKVVSISINIKNKYDGVYSNMGTFRDFVNAAFTGNYPLTYRLVTTGPSSVDVQLLVNGTYAPAYLFLNNGGGTFFGSYGLTMTFNPAAGDIISDLHNYYGDPSKPATAIGDPSLGTGAPNFASANTRRAVLDPTGINKYDNATKVIKIKHFIIQSNQSTGPNPRSALNETWTYTGPRP